MNLQCIVCGDHSESPFALTVAFGEKPHLYNSTVDLVFELCICVAICATILHCDNGRWLKEA